VKDGEVVGFGNVSDDDYHPGSANIRREDGVVEVYPIDQHGVERKWRYARQSVEEIKDQLICVEADGEWTIKREKSLYHYKTVWTDSKFDANTYGSKLLNNILGEKLFSFPKSVHTIAECLNATTQDDPEAMILDFFAGSGTTAHAVMNLNREDGGHRKYILVEMADYFDDVLVPRVKKVIFSDEWRNGEAQPNGRGTSHFVKYYQLEQYEETLRRTRYEDAPLFRSPYTTSYSQYIFLRDIKLMQATDVDCEEGSIRVDLSRLYDDIDLAETLSCITGKSIQCISEEYVEFEDGVRVNLQDPDWQLIRSLIWW
jgi:adenine-specific DNA-methyltransferase